MDKRIFNRRSFLKVLGFVVSSVSSGRINEIISCSMGDELVCWVRSVAYQV